MSEDDLTGNTDIRVVEKNVKIQEKDQQKLMSEESTLERLKELLLRIQLMCENQQVIFDQDQKRLAPLLQKWNDLAEEVQEFERQNAQ